MTTAVVTRVKDCRSSHTCVRTCTKNSIRRADVDSRRACSSAQPARAFKSLRLPNGMTLFERSARAMPIVANEKCNQVFYLGLQVNGASTRIKDVTRSLYTCCVRGGLTVNFVAAEVRETNGAAPPLGA